jgi:hypothetical protein
MSKSPLLEIKKEFLAQIFLGVEHWNGREWPLPTIEQFASHLVDGTEITDFDFIQGQRFIRARVADPVFVKEVVAKLPNDVFNYQRCNGPKESMLYCGINVDTCLTEISPGIDATFAVSEFAIKEGQTLKIAQIGGLEYFRRHERAMIDDAELAARTKLNLDKLLTAQNITGFLIDAFMAHMFSKRVDSEREYWLTSSIAKAVLEKTQADGVIYPSVEHQGGLCYAITSKAAFSKLELKSVELKKVVDKLPYNIWGTKLLKKSDRWDSDGRLIWA